MSHKQPSADTRAKAESKTTEKARLAEALRANLKRRKLAAAERTDTGSAVVGAADAE